MSELFTPYLDLSSADLQNINFEVSVSEMLTSRTDHPENRSWDGSSVPVIIAPLVGPQNPDDSDPGEDFFSAAQQGMQEENPVDVLAAMLGEVLEFADEMEEVEPPDEDEMDADDADDADVNDDFEACICVCVRFPRDQLSQL